ncbi:MAG: DUF3300 domain-containing protein [Pseudomonadota bacterium]
MSRFVHQWFARWLAFSLVALLSMQSVARAAEPLFTVDQLDQMLAPIALFPDSLLSQVLMASTYPEEVQQAADWAFANRSLEGDAAVRAVQNQNWDPSVQSLVAFPQVIAMMGENPSWVRDLGDAFLSDPEGVMDSVQFLRSKARDAGNLSSNAQQVVKVEAAPPRTQTVVVQTSRPPQQIIVIEPANPQVVFVPVYNPNVVFGTWWNPWAPPLFFPPPPRWGFTETVVGTAIAWGVGIAISNALWGNMNWRNNSVNVNVNHWNNINVNNRINSNNREINWRRNEINRPGVPPRDRNTISRERARDLAANRGNNRTQAVDDARRAQARDALANRVGAENLNRDALRNVDRSQLPNRGGTIDRNQAQNRLSNVDREQARQRAANVDRSQAQNRAANIDRTQLQNRAANVDREQARQRAAAVDRTQAQNRAATVNRDQVRQRAANVDRNQVQARPQVRQQDATRINRDNAMRGANNGAQATRQIDRGAASQRIANNPQAAQRAANNPQVRQHIANNPQAAQRAANNPQVRQRAAERRGGQ